MRATSLAIFALVLTGCTAASDNSDQNEVITSETPAPESIIEEKEETPAQSFCRDLVSAIDAADSSFRDGLADAEYGSAERLDFFSKLQAVNEIYVRDQELITQTASLNSITELFSATEGIASTVNQEDFEVFEVQDLLSDGIESLSESCPSEFNGSTAPSMFSMEYGDELFRLQMPEDKSEHFSNQVCDRISKAVEFPLMEIYGPAWGQLIEPFGEYRAIETSCSFFYENDFSRFGNAQIIEFQTNADQLSYSASEGDIGVPDQKYVFRKPGIDIRYTGEGILPQDFFVDLGYELLD